MREATGSVIRGIGLVLGVSVLAGCSGFGSNWKRALAGQVREASVEGPWEGQWTSAAGHGSGALRCILTKEAEGTYQAQFHATYKKFLTAAYVVPLAGRQEEGKLVLSGESDLGWLAGGVYEYEGDVSPGGFRVTYRAKHDYGEFVMERPGKTK